MRKLSSFLAAAILTLSLSQILVGCKFPSVGYNQGYQPEQPIAYDHSVHVGKHNIQCMYCHNQVERSKHANIPALQTCMNCHIQVKTDSPLIQKLREAYDSGKSVKWVRVHMLPDFTHFNHSTHILRGVNCETCHGQIEKMQRVYQYSDLSMGWCVNCHRKPE